MSYKKKERKKKAMKAVTLTIPESMIEELDLVSEKRKISKAQVMRMMIDLGLDCHRDLEAAGIIPLMDLALTVKMALHDKYKILPKPKPYSFNG